MSTHELPDDMRLFPDGSSREARVRALMQTTGIGDLSTSISRTIRGINHRQIPTVLPHNRDSNGLVFFTRPDLNLTSYNISQVRELTYLLSKDVNGYGRFVRTTLDPSLQIRNNSPIVSNLCDPDMAFIPLLSNTLLTMSGWPDLDLPTWTSQEGLRKEQWTQVDGEIRKYGSFDISCTFQNIEGDPISMLFNAWMMYMSGVSTSESMVPKLYNLISNTKDYETRIYNLITDHSKKYLSKIAAVNAAIPGSLPYGAAFDYDIKEPFNQSLKEININFKCTGVIYNDPILIDEFNRTVAMFNPSMRSKESRKRNMYKIPYGLLQFFNNYGYPRIDPKTYEIEWYMSERDMKSNEDAIISIVEVQMSLGDPMGYVKQLEDAGIIRGIYNK